MTACSVEPFRPSALGIRSFGQSYVLRTDAQPGKPDSGASPATGRERAEAPVDAVVCRRCLHEITSTAEAREINGTHTHTFANPEGIVFEIGCYGDAWGCGYVGSASAEFTWFSGYVWRIAVCVNCHTHLGWRFSSSGANSFHGLITHRIRSLQP